MLYRIEFNKETTLDGLLESFKNLKNCGINCYVTIGQTTIFGSDEKLEEKLEEIFKSRKQVTTSKFIEPENELQQKEIQFCQNYLNETVPKLDTLLY